MSHTLSLRFSHNHHRLAVRGCASALDVLAFQGHEALSQPFSYHYGDNSGRRPVMASLSI